MLRMMTVLALAALAAAPLAAREEKAQKLAGQAENADKKICQSEHEVGSRFPKRICHTRAEWTQITRDAEEAMRQRSHASSCGESSICGK